LIYTTYFCFTRKYCAHILESVHCLICVSASTWNCAHILEIVREYFSVNIPNTNLLPQQIVMHNFRRLVQYVTYSDALAVQHFIQKLCGMHSARPSTTLHCWSSPSLWLLAVWLFNVAVGTNLRIYPYWNHAIGYRTLVNPSYTSRGWTI
jgi:hypothetical protein